MKILVPLLIKPGLNPLLACKARELAAALIPGNPNHLIEIIENNDLIPDNPADARTPWRKVYRARNAVLDRINLNDWDYLFWPDADLIDYPSDIISRFIKLNPEGITAPLVLIEGGATFYDYTAYLEKGTDHIQPTRMQRLDGRNLNPAYPYWSTGEPNAQLVEMDCVGAINLIPSWIYKLGARYENHLAFTDHYPVCKCCRDKGRLVLCDRGTITFHADLPKWGHNWNG